jgi:tetratricopeptide (TPR) repeat protein
VQRAWLTAACFFVLLFVPPPIAAQQPPSPAELPAEYRGGEIDRALKAQDWSRAETLLVEAAERRPQQRELLQVLGSVFLILRKPLNAAIAFKKAEALGALDDRSRFALVLSYIALNRGDWARPELERLVRADASNPAYQYWLGRLDYDASQYASAIRRFEAVIARDPSFVRAYDNLGLCYEALNEPERALGHYRKAVTLNRAAESPSSWPPLNLGTLLRQRGAVEEAEAVLREAVRYDDGMAEAHYQLGMALEQAGRDADAAAALERAAQRNSEYAPTHYALARIYRRTGRADEAKRAMAVFERLHRKDREARQR